MSSRRARNEVADWRFAQAVADGAKHSQASQTSNFGSETPFLALGNITPEECRLAARMISKLAAKAGVDTDEEQRILEMVLKDFVR